MRSCFPTRHKIQKEERHTFLTQLCAIENKILGHLVQLGKGGNTTSSGKRKSHELNFEQSPARQTIVRHLSNQRSL